MAKGLTKAKGGALETSARHPGPSEREAATIRRARERQEKRSAPLSYHLDAGEEGNRLGLATQHTDTEGHDILARETFGTASEAFTHQSIGQLAAVLRERSQPVPTQTAMNAGLAAISGIAPQNEVEAMLAVEMASTHGVAMEMLTRAKLATDPAWMERYGTLATKLLRTFTTQIEALAKLRRGGEQKVTVEHVHVHPGGQAIVGNVRTGGEGGHHGTGHQAHATTEPRALAFAPGDPLLCKDAQRDRLHVAGRDRQSAVPNARGRQGKRVGQR